MLGVCLPATLCTALWGSAIPAIKSGYTLFAIENSDIAAKFVFAGIRFVGAGLVVLLVMALRGRRPLVPERGQWPGILLLGALQTILQYSLFYIGVGGTTGVKGSVLSATSTFFSVVLAHFFMQDDRLTVRRAGGCLLGFAGVIVLMGGPAALSGGFTLTGEGFMLASAFGQGAGALVSRRITPGHDPMQITGWQLCFGGGVLLVIGLVGGGAHLHFSPAGVALMAYLILLSAVAFTVWTHLLARYPVTRVTIYMFLVPVFGSLLSALVLQEQVFTLPNLGALVLVSGGIAMVNLAGGKTKN